MKLCPAGEPITKQSYETIRQFEKRERDRLCSSQCRKKHHTPENKVSRPTSDLTTADPSFWDVGPSGLKRVEKEVNWRSEAYLDFIRSLPSCVPGGGQVIAHHVGRKGVKGIACKVGDDRAVPLAAIPHALLHQVGEKAFWAAKMIDVEQLILSLNEEYMRQGHTLKR